MCEHGEIVLVCAGSAEARDNSGGRVHVFRVLVGAQGPHKGVPAGRSVGDRGRSGPLGFSPPGEEPPLIGISWIFESFKASVCESASTSGSQVCGFEENALSEEGFPKHGAQPALLTPPFSLLLPP